MPLQVPVRRALAVSYSRSHLLWELPTDLRDSPTRNEKIIILKGPYFSDLHSDDHKSTASPLFVKFFTRISNRPRFVIREGATSLIIIFFHLLFLNLVQLRNN